MLFKGMREMLAAVVAAGKGDIRDLHGAVRQQKGSLFEPLLCNIADDGAAHLPRKQKLQIGFVNTGMCGDQRDSQRLEKVLLDIGAGLFQIGGALCPAGVLRAEEKFQNHSGKEKPHQLRAVVLCKRKLRDQILHRIAEIALVLRNQAGMSCFQPCGKAGAALKQFPKWQLRLFPAKAVKFQIQDCAGASGTDFQPVRCICR